MINGSQVSLKMVDSVGYGNSMELKSWRRHIQDYIKGNVRIAFHHLLLAHSILRLIDINRGYERKSLIERKKNERS